MTDPMVEFVLACADEDEEIAKVGPYDPDSEDYEAEIKRDALRDMQLHSRHCGWRLGEGMSDECECGAPARVLARCAADRAIVMMYRSTLAAMEADPSDMSARVAALGLRLTVLHLANANADHPDFWEEWKL